MTGEKGKSKKFDEPMETTADCMEDKSLPWEGLYFGDCGFVGGSKCHDMYAEGADGKLQLVKVYKEDDDDYDSQYSDDENYDDKDPDIPCFVTKKTRYEHSTW